LALAEVALMGGRLVVTEPVGSAAAVRKAVLTWYRHHAAERLPERAAIVAKKMGVPTPLVPIRDPRLRWGRYEARGGALRGMGARLGRRAGTGEDLC
jgi:predicted metal-dependent hydrolase